MIISTLNTLLSLSKKLLSYLGSPFVNVVFSFKVYNDSSLKPNCELKVYNLNKENMMVRLTTNKYINVKIPRKNSIFYKYSWDSCENDSQKRTCKNSWLVLKPLQQKKYAKIRFKINNSDKVGKINFYDYKSRHSISIFFKRKNEKWNFKVGKLNLYKHSEDE